MSFFNQFTRNEWQIFIGNTLMAVTSLFYILWWRTSFQDASAGGAFISLAILTGLVSVALIAVSALEVQGRGLSESIIILAALPLYIALFFITTGPLHRPLTSELLIIIVWAVAEFSAVNLLYGCRRFNLAEMISGVALISAAVTAGLVCYVRYYTFPANSAGRFWLGIYPLAIDGIVVAALLLMQAFSKAPTDIPEG